jgi:molybdopterin-containing oxidoreductase family membrane subunit
LLAILRVTVLINLFLLGCEMFTVLHTGAAHSESLRYLLFGLDGHARLVPWFWAAVAMNTLAAWMLLQSRAVGGGTWLGVACILTFVGVWIEKGPALIVPGFIPSPIHEMVEYSPTGTEWMITVGIWAVGLLIFSAGLRVALPLISDRRGN